MLQRVQVLKNIGRFRSLACSRDDRLRFRRFTAIYAKNGAGKTTLAAVIRSMAEKDASILRPWRTVTEPGADQLAVLELSTGIARFDGSSWSDAELPFAVFDREFIESNIYIGRSIGKKQREGFLRLALGSTEATAARAVDDLASEIKTLNKPIRQLIQSLTATAEHYNLTLEEFLKLAAPDEAELASARKYVSDATIAQEVLKRPFLQVLPDPPSIDFDSIRELLLTSIDQSSTKAEVATQRHLSSYMRVPDEQWLRRGLSLSTGSHCPFCEQPLKQANVVEDYTNYFTPAYKDLQRKIDEQLESIAPPGDWWGEVVTQGRLNTKAIGMWKTELEGLAPVFGSEERKTQNQLIVEELRALLQAKRDKPTTEIPDGQRITELQSHWHDLRSSVVEYNKAAIAANDQLKSCLEDFRHLNIDKARNHETTLLAARKSHDLTTRESIDNYHELLQERRRLKGRKERARERLDEAQKNRLLGFVKKINELLHRMEIGFSVESISAEMTGGTAGAAIGINLDGAKLDLGIRSKEDPFATVLSEGDRSALAFATFIANLLNEPTLSNLIVVIDDPVTSLDDERFYATIDLIGDLADRCSQLIVLSHQAEFLLVLAERIPARHSHIELELSRSLREFRPWDSKQHCANQWLRLRNRIKRFIEDETQDHELESIRGNLRCLLEDYLRFRWPEHFPMSGTLEKYARTLRQPALTSALPFDEAALDELDQICRFSQREHHGQALRGAPKPSASDVRSYARRTIAWLNL